MADANAITPERLLLAAIFQALGPNKQAAVLQLVGETTAENVVRLRAPRTTEERNELVTQARRIAGIR